MPNGVTILTPCAPIIRAIADTIVFPVISSSYAFLLSGMKKVPVPLREQGQKTLLSAVPPCLPVKPTAHPAPTRRVPSNAGNASEDTQDSPFPSALGGPFAAPLFAPLSAMGNSLWMRLQLYFRVCGLLYLLKVFIHHAKPFVKHYFSPLADKCA